MSAKKNRSLAIAISAAAGLSLVVCVVIIVILPVFSFSSAEIPAACLEHASNHGSDLPSNLGYAVPGVGIGTLLAEDARSAAVAVSDRGSFPFKTSLYLINKDGNQVIRSLSFDNDFLSVGIHQGIVYIYNDKILYLVDASSGEDVRSFLKIDNFRGVYRSGQTWTVQTDVEISAIGLGGALWSHVKLPLQSTAYGCFIP